MTRRGGFTYIEILIVIVITMLFAALVMPNLVTEKKRRDEWKFRTELRSLGKNARSRAIEVGRNVSLAYDKNKNEIQIIEIDKNGSEVKTHTMAIPDWLTISKFVSNQSESVGDSWRVPFFADGATTGGGIIFKADERTWSLVVSPVDSTVKDLDGTMPDFSYESWPAGSNVAPTS